MTREIYYLDTNVYDRLFKRDGVSAENILELKAVCARGQLAIISSDVVLEELTGTFNKSAADGTGRLDLASELTCNFSLFLKPHEEMFAEEVKAVAAGKGIPSPFANTSRLSSLRDGVSVARYNYTPGLKEAIAQSETDKTAFRDSMFTAYQKLLPEKAKLANQVPEFATYYRRVAQGLGEYVVTRVLGSIELNAERILQIPTVGLYSGASASLIYAQTFEERKVKRSDGRDLLHAALASAADVFVTDDSKFRRVLGRVPARHYRMVNTLEFLGEVGVSR